MCRNIKTLLNFEPPATRDEVEASALQYVRKLSGMTRPSQKNQAAFDHAVAQITKITFELLDSLEINAPPRTREQEREKAKERGQKREEQMRDRVLKSLNSRLQT